MGEAKKINDTTPEAKFTGFKHKISAFKTIDFKKFHEEIGIKALSSSDVDGRFFEFDFIHYILGDGRAIGNKNAFVVFAKCIEGFDTFLHSHGIFANGIEGFQERIGQKIDGFTHQKIF